VSETVARRAFPNQFDFNKEVEQQNSHNGSYMIVIATDAPVSSRNLLWMEKRAALGLARTSSYMSNGSGDFIIAFSTKNLIPVDSTSLLQIQELPNDQMDPLFLPTVEAVEEAVYNSLVAAKTVKGYQGNVREAIPIDRLKEFFIGNIECFDVFHKRRSRTVSGYFRLELNHLHAW
jgi:D-aminopeptidase